MTTIDTTGWIPADPVYLDGHIVDTGMLSARRAADRPHVADTEARLFAERVERAVIVLRQTRPAPEQQATVRADAEVVVRCLFPEAVWS